MADLVNDPLQVCPNCTQRRADTVVDYYEVVQFDYSAQSHARRRRQVSLRKTWVEGKSRLCGQCAGLYTRSVTNRRLGRRLVSWGTAVVIGGAILFLILNANVAPLRQGAGELASAIPTLLGLIGVIVGLALLAQGTILKRRATRFLEKKLRSS